MKLTKRLVAVSAASALLFSGCGSSSSTTYEPVAEADETIYHIAMIADDDTSYYTSVNQGFVDALSDLFGSEHLSITNEVTEDTELIFANGKSTLSAYAESETETPIVACGVMDYQHLLHITVESGESWDRTTGTNVTGINATPDLVDQVSLLIETTNPLTSVGLLYTPTDEDALYQLSTIEKYLDQAGIPWKEYALPLQTAILEDDGASSETEDDTDDEASTATVITPSKVVAPSLTEGAETDVELFGESSLSGLISPSSAHAAATSQFWTDDLSAANAEEDAPDADDFEGIITYASRECSALFITTGNLLSDETERIAAIATAAGVTTVGGDATIGAHTLTSSYQDPYAQGYAAGRRAYRILVDGENPGEIKVAKADTETVKLYNGDIAEEFGMEFPKSFSEITDFFETYEIGSSTTRITSEEE